MKQATILLSLVFTGLQTMAQKTIDRTFQQAKPDTATINLLNQIASDYVESYPDSALKCATDALSLSRMINYAEGEINAIRNISGAFTVTGNYAKALENALESLKKSEALGNKDLIKTCLWAVGGVYSFQEDHQQALVYILKTLELYKDRPADKNFDGALLNTGVTYFNLGRYDSSRYYFQQCLEAAAHSKDSSTTAAVYLNFGRLALKTRHYDSAMLYFRKALPVFLTTNNHLFIYSTYYFFAEAFDSTHQVDSALYYSRLSLHHANAMNSSAHIAEITKQLSLLCKQTGRYDSAYYYMAMAMTARDSLIGQDNQKKIQLLIFNEQLRQLEIAEQKRKDAATRKRNLQLVAIAIFIPLFLLAVLLMGRRKVKSRTIEFLGVLALLFLFEFIVLFAHPYIGHWTHESPVWMLLILVAIAAILVPLHHRSSHWMKKKLSSKTSNVVSPAAGKLITNPEGMPEQESQ